MSSQHIREQNLRYEATQGNFVPRSPAAATAEKVVASEQLEKFLYTFAIIELVAFIISFAHLYVQGLPVCYFVEAFGVAFFSMLVTFGVYSILNAIYKIDFQWAADKNLNLYLDIPLPPPPTTDTKANNTDLDQNTPDQPGDEIEFKWPSNQKVNAPLRPSPRQQSTQLCKAVDTNNIDEIWAEPDTQKSIDDTQRSRISVPESTSATPFQFGLTQAIDTSDSAEVINRQSTPATTYQLGHLHIAGTSNATEVVQQQPSLQQEPALSPSEALSSLNALLDQMVKDAERDGCTASEYRHRKKLAALFKSVSHNHDGYKQACCAVEIRVQKYAETHTSEKINSLWSRAIGLTYPDGKPLPGTSGGLWNWLKVHKQKKEHSEKVAAKQAREHEEKMRVKKEHFLQEVRKHAIKFGLEKSRETFSAERHPEWADEVTAVLDKYRDQKAEKKRLHEAQKEALLDSIRDVARTCGLEIAIKRFSERLKKFIPENKIPKFYQTLEKQLYQEEADHFNRHPRKKAAFFKGIGADAVKEALFDGNISRGKHEVPKYRKHKTTGMKTEILYAKKTFAYYKDTLAAIVGKENARKKFLEIYDNELKRNGNAWRWLLYLKAVAEEYNSVIYIGFWSRDDINSTCKYLGFEPAEFWTRVTREVERRQEVRAEMDAKAEGDAVIAELTQARVAAAQETATAAKMEAAVAALAAQQDVHAQAMADAREQGAQEATAVQQGEPAALAQQRDAEAEEEPNIQVEVPAAPAQQHEPEAEEERDNGEIDEDDDEQEVEAKADDKPREDIVAATIQFLQGHRPAPARPASPVPDDTISAAQQSLTAEDAQKLRAAFTGLTVRIPPAGRLLQPTARSSQPPYTAKSWNANAGGFATYWKAQAAQNPLPPPLASTRNSGSRFAFRHAQDEIYPMREDLTIYPHYGYMLRYRLATKELGARERKELAEKGYVWPTQGSLAPRWAAWKPALEFKLPVGSRGYTIFRGMMWTPSVAEMRVREAERRAAEAKGEEEREVEKATAEMAVLDGAANTLLPESEGEDEDIAAPKPVPEVALMDKGGDVAPAEEEKKPAWDPSAFQTASWTAPSFDPSAFQGAAFSLAPPPVSEDDREFEPRGRASGRPVAREGRRARR